MTDIKVGDAIQFSLNNAQIMPSWREFPKTYHELQNYFGLRFSPDWQVDYPALWRTHELNQPFLETKKIYMLVIEIKKGCFTLSKNPILRKLATRTFFKVLAISPNHGAEQVWVCEKDVELYQGNSYLEGLKIQLLKKVTNT